MPEETPGMSCDISMETTPLPPDPVPAMAYVPYQQWQEGLLAPEKALSAGTLFPVLDKPFLRGKGWQNE